MGVFGYLLIKQIIGVLRNPEINLLNLINPSLAHVYCSTTLSNHELIRFKKIISQNSRIINYFLIYS
jgi:hypothetical protein